MIDLSWVPSVFAFIILTTLPGIPIVTLLLRRFLSLLQLVATGVGISLILNGVALFYLGLLKSADSADLILTTFLMTVIALPLAYLSRAESRQASRSIWAMRMSVPSLLCSVYVILILSLYAIHSFSMPFTEWDAIMVYNHWAVQFWQFRVIVPGSGFGEIHSEGLGAAYAWLYVVIGTVNEHFAHLLTPVFGAIAIIFAWGLAEELELPSWLAAFLLISVPEFGYTLHSGFSDLPSAALATGSIFLLVKAQKLTTVSPRLKCALFLLSGVMMGGAVWFRLSALVLAAGMIIYIVWVCGTSRKLNLIMILPIVIGIVSMMQWLVWIICTEGVQPFIYQGHALMTDPFTWGYPNPSLADRVVRSLQTTIGSGNPILLATILWGALLALLWRGGIRRLSFSFFVPVWLVWCATLSYDLRYMIVVLPLASVLATRPVWTLLKSAWGSAGKIRIHSHSLRPIVGLLLILVVTRVTWGSILQAVQGPGPELTWSLTHLTATDDEKRLAVLGNMYEAVLYVRSHPRLYSAPILTPDSRIPIFLENANYGWPMTLEDMRSYEYLILGAWAFEYYPWKDSLIAQMIRSGDPRIVIVASFGWQHDPSQNYNGYAIFQISASP